MDAEEPLQPTSASVGLGWPDESVNLSADATQLADPFSPS